MIPAALVPDPLPILVTARQVRAAQVKSGTRIENVTRTPVTIHTSPGWPAFTGHDIVRMNIQGGWYYKHRIDRFLEGGDRMLITRPREQAENKQAEVCIQHTIVIAAMVFILLILITVAVLTTLPEMGYFGFPFSVRFGDAATESFVAVTPQDVAASAVEDALERFAETNNFSVRRSQIPDDAERINLVMENPRIGRFVVDNHIHVHRYVCFFYSHGHPDTRQMGTVIALKKALLRSGAEIQTD
jgi:TusA-related sulfurtransferase